MALSSPEKYVLLLFEDFFPDSVALGNLQTQIRQQITREQLLLWAFEEEE